MLHFLIKTIIVWGGIDIYTGIIIEKGHPLEGRCLKDTVLILDGSRGSNGWSLFFHADQVSGCGPVALVFPRLDSRTAVTAAFLNVPMVTDISVDIFDLVKTGDSVQVDGGTGIIEIGEYSRRKFHCAFLGGTFFCFHNQICISAISTENSGKPTFIKSWQ